MRDVFPGFYRPTDEEFDRMWREGLFVVDANVLLNLYRYSRETRGELLRLLGALGDRLWIPHQVAQEFLRRRIGVIHQQRRKAQELRAHLAEVRGGIEDRVRALTRDPSVEPGEHLNKLLGAFDELEVYLKGQADGSTPLSNSSQDDEVWAAVEELVDGRMGEGYAQGKLREVEKEWEERKELKVPPGFKDDGPGDLILWRQTMEKAGETHKPVVFVTDDRKEDWWWIEQGRTVGPRRHLVEEMRREVGVAFHMYTPDRFMKYAAERLEQDVSEEAISEAEGLGEVGSAWDSVDSGFGRPPRGDLYALAIPHLSSLYTDLELSPFEETVLREFFLNGRDAVEVAEELSITPAAVRRALRGVLEQVRMLRGRGEPEEADWGVGQSGTPHDFAETEGLLRALAAAPLEDRRAIARTLTPLDVRRLLDAVVGRSDRVLGHEERLTLMKLLSDFERKGREE